MFLLFPRKSILKLDWMAVIFNLHSSHLLTLSLPTEDVFQVNGQNRPAFHSQLGKFEPHCLLAIHIFLVFSPP